MWVRKQFLLTPEQARWLRAEAYTSGRRETEIVRELIDEARRRREGRSKNESGSSTSKD